MRSFTPVVLAAALLAAPLTLAAGCGDPCVKAWEKWSKCAKKTPPAAAPEAKAPQDERSAAQPAQDKKKKKKKKASADNAKKRFLARCRKNKPQFRQCLGIAKCDRFVTCAQ